MFRFVTPKGIPDYDEPLYRPPSEAYSLIFQVSLGCSHNKCAFCYMYRGKRFRVRPKEEVLSEIETAAENLQNVEKIFFADGDALAIKADRLVEYAELCYKRFNKLERISLYATPQNFLQKSLEDLKRVRAAGIKLAYFGVESGDPETLLHINKGATPEEMIEAAEKAHSAGFELSVTVILGLAGVENSARHAENTGKLISEISPRYVGALTLMLGPYAGQYVKEYEKAWTPLNKQETLREIKIMLENIEAKGELIFRSNHASNYLALKGALPADKEELLQRIEETLSDPHSPHWRAEEWRGL